MGLIANKKVGFDQSLGELIIGHPEGVVSDNEGSALGGSDGIVIRTTTRFLECTLETPSIARTLVTVATIGLSSTHVGVFALDRYDAKLLEVILKLTHQALSGREEYGTVGV